MKKMKKLLAAALAAATVLTLCAGPALADGERGEKEEVVYINLDSSGGVSSVSVVNIFDLAQEGQIVDHGAYTAVRNMTGTEPVALEGDTVTIQAGPGRVYYEGELSDAAIPWLFDIRYFLDGKEQDAAGIAGKSGALEIRLSVREDPDCKGDFFDSHALQASLTLDGERCADIEAPGATEANVGGDKQLTYTILPGQGADITVKARVTDFAMEPIAINGVSLALDVQVDDGELLDKVSELTDAVDTLNEGAEALSGGVADLQTGADALNGGAGAVRSGAAELQSGAASLESGAYQFQSGLDALAGQSAGLTGGARAVKDGLAQMQQTLAGASITPDQIAQLQQGAADMTATLAAMKAGVDDLQAGIDAMDMSQLPTLIAGNQAAIGGLSSYVSLFPDLQKVIDVLTQDNTVLSGLSSLSGGLTTLSDGMTKLQNGFTAFSAAIEKMAGSMGALPDNMQALKTAVDALAAGASDLDAGVAAYAAGVARLQSGFGSIVGGAASLAEGSGELASGAGSLTEGAASLAEGVAALGQGAGQMAEGTAEMARQTDGMDGKIQDQIGQLLSGVTGSDGPARSFVSWRNRDVAAVQFVIRTPPIEKPAPSVTEPAQEEQPGFWDKLKDLF